MPVSFLNGWGVSEDEAFGALKECVADNCLEVIQPTADWRDRLDACDSNCLIAYSTGAFLALSEPGLFRRFEETILLAPFFDFKAEAGMGGRVRLPQLSYLLRWLTREPLAAVNDFRQRAGIESNPLTALPAKREDLIWAIQQLMEVSLPCEAPSVCCYIGKEDPLLDAGRLTQLIPEMHILEKTGHRLDDLLKGAFEYR